MKATDLQQVLRIFDPNRPLAGEELDSWFVERPDSPRKRLRVLLEADHKPRKILLAGQRGSGKTTELGKLAAELDPGFQTLHVDALEVTGGTSLTAVDLLRTIAHCFDGLRPKRIEKVSPRRLIALLDEAAAEIQVASGARLLLVIEGLDKIDPALARGVLHDDAATITAPRVAITYVVSAALRHFSDFDRIRESFSDFQLLPNVPTYRRDGSVDVEAHRLLRQLVLARVEESLIEHQAMELLLRMNGGQPQRLAALVRDATLQALARNARRIDRGDMENAVADARRELVVSLDPEYQEILRARHADHRFTSGRPREILLFDRGRLIEFADDVPWCDAHPLLWPLLEETSENDAAPWEPAHESREAPSAPADVYVRSVALKDVKGIREARLDVAETADGAPGWYVFAGGNGSGKSTLLRSLALAMVGRGSALGINRSWVRNGAQAATATVSFLAPGVEEELSSSVEIRPDGELEARSDEATRKLLRQAWFLAGYGPFKRLEGGSDLAGKIARGDPLMGRVITLFLEEAFLSEVPEWIRHTLSRRRPLTTPLLELLNSGLMPEGFRAKQIKEELVLASPDGPPMPLRMTSDGPRCMVAMILDILRGLKDCHGSLQIEDQRVLNPGVVLIDEPDNHLHIQWQLELPSWLKEHFPRIQFIVATHSPFLCAAADRIWRLDDEEGRIEPQALSDEEMREIGAGSITTVLQSDAFRIFNTLPLEARERHVEFLRLRRLELQGKRLSKADRTLLSELKQEFFGPKIPRDPEFEALFP